MLTLFIVDFRLLNSFFWLLVLDFYLISFHFIFVVASTSWQNTEWSRMLCSLQVSANFPRHFLHLSVCVCVCVSLSFYPLSCSVCDSHTHSLSLSLSVCVCASRILLRVALLCLSTLLL